MTARQSSATDKGEKMTNDAIREHAQRCLDAADGWDEETLAFNIESHFPGADWRVIERIALELLNP